MVLCPGKSRGKQKSRRPKGCRYPKYMFLHWSVFSFAPRFSSGHTVNIMVPKQAVPPIKLEIGSAINIPVVPRLNTAGSIRISGMTMMTLRKMEKNTAFFDFPSPTNTAWPANWRDIMKNPKKYTRMAGTPASTSSPSLLKMRMK